MTVKTTISLPEEIFERMEREVKESGTPRSRFVAEALDERLQRLESERLLALYNEAYADDDPAEKQLRDATLDYYRERLEREGE
ncbi:MAG: ribbon-helix-helix protein, CopG family [Acidobacteria bacterium]|nr:ribbon-helix-helix protein, CopG family [Acidobacteriota bacterium]